MLALLLNAIFIILCMFWMLYWVIKGFKAARLTVAKEDVKVPVKCEKCKLHFDATQKELIMTSPFNKSKSISVQTPTAGVTVATTLKKKCYCPNCNKIVWVKILDPIPLQIESTKEATPIIIKYFLISAIPFIIMVIIAQISSFLLT